MLTDLEKMLISYLETEDKEILKLISDSLEEKGEKRLKKHKVYHYFGALGMQSKYTKESFGSLKEKLAYIQGLEDAYSNSGLLDDATSFVFFHGSSNHEVNVKVLTELRNEGLLPDEFMEEEE